MSRQLIHAALILVSIGTALPAVRAQQAAPAQPASVLSRNVVRPVTPRLLTGIRPTVATMIQGNALTSTNAQLPNAVVRLRDARFGRIVGTEMTDQTGLFTFRNVDPGTYIVEMMGDDSTVLAASQLLNVNGGDIVSAVVKLTPAGRRFEGVGANETAALTSGLRVKRHRAAAYVWAQILYCVAALLHAGIVNQPTAYEGNNYLLPSVAAVVLGGTSLLGGRGNLVATAIAALFLSQLDQFVLALGVGYATRTLVQAAALAVGVALYTIDWRRLVRRVSSRRATTLAPT